MKNKARNFLVPTNNNIPLDNIPRVTVTLTDETCFLTRHDERGAPINTYRVTLPEAAASFAGMSDVTTGLLPRNVLFAGRRTCAIYIPPQVRDLRFPRLSVRVNLPGFVFAGHGNQYFIHALNCDPYNTTRVSLFVAPLPNVHPDTGLVCAGNVKFPKCSPETIHHAADLFFLSEFNSDLSDEKIKDDSTSLLNFLRKLNGKKIPANQLIATGTLLSVYAKTFTKQGDKNEHS